MRFIKNFIKFIKTIFVIMFHITTNVVEIIFLSILKNLLVTIKDLTLSVFYIIKDTINNIMSSIKLNVILLSILFTLILMSFSIHFLFDYYQVQKSSLGIQISILLYLLVVQMFNLSKTILEPFYKKKDLENILDSKNRQFDLFKKVVSVLSISITLVSFIFFFLFKTKSIAQVSWHNVFYTNLLPVTFLIYAFSLILCVVMFAMYSFWLSYNSNISYYYILHKSYILRKDKYKEISTKYNNKKRGQS